MREQARPSCRFTGKAPVWLVSRMVKLAGKISIHIVSESGSDEMLRRLGGRREMRPRGWLLLLCGYLTIWQPLTLASEVSATLGTLGMRGPAGIAELSAHAAVTAFAVATGWGLWIGNPKAPVFAELALVACALASVQSLYWTRLPANTMPGDRLPLAIVAIAHAAGWMTYLRKSRRVRSLFVSAEADATSWLSTRPPSP